MKRTETICQKCRQVNVRYHGRGSWFMNPRSAEHCTLCGVHLVTGERGLYYALHGWLMWTALYLGHVVAGSLGLSVAVASAWPGIINQPFAVRVLPGALGLVIGVVLVEWSRRTGTLLGHSKLTGRS